MMIFVPLRPDQLDRLVRDGVLRSVTGFAATAVLRRSHEVVDDEEADFVAFGYAEAAAIRVADRPGTGRVVVAVDLGVPATTGSEGDDATGRFEVETVDWRQVTAIYLDDPSAVDEVAAVRAATAGLDEDAAYADPGLLALLEGHDLLWHLPAEVAD